MNYRKIILPAIVCASFLLAGWHSWMPSNNMKSQLSTLDQLQTEISKISLMDSGTEFTLTLTDTDLTNAANEALKQYQTEVEQMIKNYAGIGIKVSDPKIVFTENNFSLSVKAGVSFIKVNASAAGTISAQNGIPVVTFSAIDTPIGSVPVEQANSFVQTEIGESTGIITAICSYSDIQIHEGQIVITGKKK